MMNSRSQGFTLVELLVGIIVGAIVLAAAYSTMTTQERTNRQQIAVVTTEQNTRMALELLSSELREVSASGNDIYAADSVSISFRALRKAGLICNKDYVNGNWADVAVFGNPFNGSNPPDSVLVFQDGPNLNAGSDDTWGVYRVQDIGTTPTCTGNAFGNLQRLVFPGSSLTLADSGALIRSFVRVGYRLVGSGNRGTLYRMENNWQTSDSSAVVENLASPANGGLRLRYFDALGNSVNPSTAAARASIMRMQIKIGGRYVGGQVGAQRTFTDSLVGSVFLRGNRKTQ